MVEIGRLVDLVVEVVGVLMGLGVRIRSLSISNTLAISCCMCWMSLPN